MSKEQREYERKYAAWLVSKRRADAANWARVNVSSKSSKFAEDYVLPAAKLAGSFTPAGVAIGLTDAYNAYKQGDTTGAIIGAGLEALPYGIGKVFKYIPKVNKASDLLYTGNNIKKYVLSGIRFDDDIATKTAQKIADKSIQEFDNVHSIRRMKNLGIDTNRFFMVKPTIIGKAQKTSEGSNHFSGLDTITIDFPQLKELKDIYGMKMKDVMEHELAHRMQVKSNNLSIQDIKDDPMKLTKRFTTRQLEIDRDLIDAPSFLNIEEMGVDARKAYDYFIKGSRGLERFPMMMEAKANMLRKGIINNRWDVVTPDKLNKFLSENPKNRIASFTDKKDDWGIRRLSDYFNMLPAATGVAVGTGLIRGSKVPYTNK